MAFMRKAIASQCRALLEVGCTYEQVEKGLRLHPRNGMTVWEMVNGKPRKSKKSKK